MFTLELELGIEFIDLEMSYILVGHQTFITRDFNFIQREGLTERTETETANEEHDMYRLFLFNASENNKLIN